MKSTFSGRNNLPILVTGFLTIAALLWFLFPENFIADDSYFYLVIGRNSALHGSQSFSGLFPTNGIHPAWQWMLTGASSIAGAINPELLWNSRTLLWAPLLCLVGGALLLNHVSQRLGLHVATTLILITGYLGAFGLLYSEAHLAFATIAWTLALGLQNSSYRRAILLGIATGLTILARLDSVLFVLPFYIWYWRSERSLRSPIISAALCGSMVGAYLLWNQLVFGSPIPISGWLKSSFPSITVKLLSPGGAFYGGFAGYRFLWGFVPLIASTGLAVIFYRRLMSKPYSLLLVPLAASWLQFAYIALFTTHLTFWPWYYVVPVLTLALLGGLFVQQAFRPWPRTAISCLLAAFFLFVYATDRVGRDRDVSAWKKTPLLMATELGIDGRVILVSDNPGYLAFHTRNSVIAADMLTGNRQLYDEMMVSENALDFLFAEAQALGRPIEYVFYTGNFWLRPSPDLQKLVYHDPKTYPKKNPIGRRVIGEPIGSFKADGATFRAWKVNPEATHSD